MTVSRSIHHFANKGLYSQNMIFLVVMYGASLTSIHVYMGFPDSSVGKESTRNAGDPSLIPGSGRSAREGIA